MQRINFFKIFSMIAFLALAFVSCKWTAESLYMWQSNLGIVGAWTIAVITFVIASLCFTQFVKSLDRNEDFYGKLFGRTGALLLGLVGIIFFWICISLPTNTHTLIYGASVKETMRQDIAETRTLLGRAVDQNAQVRQIEAERDKFATDIELMLNKLSEECNNYTRVGFGKNCKNIVETIVNRLQTKLGDKAEIDILTNHGTTARDARSTYDYYKFAVYARLKMVNEQYTAKIAELRKTINPVEINKIITNLNAVDNALAHMEGVDSDIIKKGRTALEWAYPQIKANSAYITFDSDTQKARYTADRIEPMEKELKNVQKVVGDYFTTDKYKGFGYWILIAMLVDIAGFIFFTIAFKR